MNTAALAAFLAAVALATAFAILWLRERRRVRRLRHALEADRQRADNAARAGDAFFDLVSHELRSPIAAIVGYQELLDDGAYGAMGDAAHEPLQRIGRSARYLLNLVDGTVDLARDRVGTFTPRLESVDLQYIMDETARAFRTHARERSLRCSVDIDPHLPDIRSDPERLTRALDLLVFSAVKHPAGERVELTVEPEDDGATVRVRGTRLPTYEADDPAVRAGIRMAIVAVTARRLGGDLRLECGADGVATELVLRIRGAPPL
jgi:signal transduction histidine kinase